MGMAGAAVGATCLLKDARVLEELFGTDEQHRTQFYELLMAKRALEAAYARNQALCKLHFCHNDSAITTSNVPPVLDDSSTGSDAQTLESLPPVAEGAAPHEAGSNRSLFARAA